MSPRSRYRGPRPSPRAARRRPRSIPRSSAASATHAVHRPGVEVGEPERPGDAPRHGGLAGPGGAVDRDNHERSLGFRLPGPGYRVPRADGELEPQRAGGRAAPAAGARLRVRGPRDRDQPARRASSSRSTRSTSAPGCWSSRGTSRSPRPTATASGGPGLLAIFDPKERHEVEAAEDSRLLLVLSPWPGDGHPSQPEPRLSRRCQQRAQIPLEARVADRDRLEAVDLDALLEARPAIAPTIARRWSPRGVELAAAQAARPADHEAVGPRLDRRRPRPARPSTTPRSGPTPWPAAPRRRSTTVSPSAKQPSRATSGSSSIAAGTSSAVISVAAAAPRCARAGSRSAPARARGSRRTVIAPPPRAPAHLDPHAREDREQADPVAVDADLAQLDLAARDDQRRREEEGGRGEVARHRHVARLQALGRRRRSARRPRGGSRRPSRRASARCGRGSRAARGSWSRPRPAARRAAGRT